MAVKNKKTDSTVFLFQYKTGNTFMHKLPAWIKIVLLFIFGTVFFFISPYACIILMVLLTVYTLNIGISLQEQLHCLKPVAYYAILLYTVSLMNKMVIPQKQDIVLCIRLTVALQTTSLIFFTTSPLELRSGIECIETAIRKSLPVSKKAQFSELFSFFLLFLPMVIKTWQQLEYSWKARGGKNTPRKILVLFPILLSLCMHKVWTTERAVRNRETHTSQQ
ncbi:MAG: hypothetical protein K6E51_13310 [Treponema sp.]|nr:hypothetical protein [Treponema sp.]